MIETLTINNDSPGSRPFLRHAQDWEEWKAFMEQRSLTPRRVLGGPPERYPAVHMYTDEEVGDIQVFFAYQRPDPLVHSRTAADGGNTRGLNGCHKGRDAGSN